MMFADNNGNSFISHNATTATPFSSSSVRPPLVRNGLLWGLLGVLGLYASLIGTFVFLGPLLVTLRLHLFKYKMCGLALLMPVILGAVAISNVILVRREAARATANADAWTAASYIGFGTVLITTVGHFVVVPMRSQLRGYILRPLLVAFVSMTATQGVAAIGSSFLLPLFAASSRLQRVVIRLIVFPVISEAVLTAVRLVCRISFTPSLASQYTIMWLTPPLLATSLLGRLLATNLSSLGEAIAIAIMIALVERGMRLTMPYRDFAAERCLQACNWGQARGRARDAVPEAVASTPSHGGGTPVAVGASSGTSPRQGGLDGDTSAVQDTFAQRNTVVQGLPVAYAAVGASQQEALPASNLLRNVSDSVDPGTHNPPPNSGAGAIRLSSQVEASFEVDDMPEHKVMASVSIGSSASSHSMRERSSDARELPQELPSEPVTLGGAHTPGAVEQGHSPQASMDGAPAHRVSTESGDPHHSSSSNLNSAPSWTLGSATQQRRHAQQATVRTDGLGVAAGSGDVSKSKPNRLAAAQQRPDMPPLHPPTASLGISAGQPSSDTLSAHRSAHASPSAAAAVPPHVRIRADPVRSADAQIEVQTDSGASSMPLWRVWHTRRWNHFQNAYLEVDTLSEDVGIMVSLPLALLFRLPPEPGAAPLSGAAVGLRVFLQLLIELLTELAPVFVMLLVRACSRVPGLPVSASHLAREVLKLPALRNAEIISTPTGIQLRLLDTPKAVRQHKKSSKHGVRADIGPRSTASTSPLQAAAGCKHAKGHKVRPSLQPLSVVGDCVDSQPQSAKNLADAKNATARHNPSQEDNRNDGTASSSHREQQLGPAEEAHIEMAAVGGGAAADTSGSAAGTLVESADAPTASADSVASIPATPHQHASPQRPKRMTFGFGRRASKAGALDKSFSHAAAAAWYLTSPHPSRRRSSAGSASTAFGGFGPVNCCERQCPRTALACEDNIFHCRCLKSCAVRCSCHRMCRWRCLPVHVHRVVCHGPECSSLEAHKGECCCGSSVPRSTSSWCCAVLKAPFCMFVARSWRLFLGCCMTPWDRSVLRESSIALRRIWVEDMAVERASLWQPFELTAVMRAVYDPSRQRQRHDALCQGARNLLLDDSNSNNRTHLQSSGNTEFQPGVSPVEDPAACCCTSLCAKSKHNGSQELSQAARISSGAHWLGIVAEVRTVKRLHAWQLLPPGFRVLFVLMSASVVLVIVWQTMNVQLRCPFTLSADVQLAQYPDAPLKFDFCAEA